MGSDKPHTGRELEVQEVGKPATPDIKISSNMFYVLAKQKKTGGFEPPGSNKKNVVLPPSPKWTEKVREDYEKGKVNVECIRGDTQKVSKIAAPNRQTKCENKEKYGETSFDSFPANSAPFRYLFVWKVILFLWCTQVKQKVVASKIILLRFMQVLRGVDSQEEAGQPECSSNPHLCSRGFSPGGHKKNPNLTEQAGTTRCRPPSPHRQTRPKGVERMKRELLQAVWPAWLKAVVQVMQYKHYRRRRYLQLPQPGLPDPGSSDYHINLARYISWWCDSRGSLCSTPPRGM